MHNLHKHWKVLMLVTAVISLISIKGFPITLGALYLPVLFKVVKLQMKLSEGLVSQRDPEVFIKSNQKGVIISVICCIVATFILFKPLGAFYASLTGILGLLISISTFTLIISIVLYIITAIAVIQAVKFHYRKSSKIVN